MDLLISIFLALIIFAQVSLTEEPKAKINELAPEFTLKSSNGEEISLSKFKDKIVVLEWINFDCPFVKKHYESQNMQNLQKEYRDKGIVWLSICSSAPGKEGHLDNAEINKRIKKHKSYQNYYLIDEDGKVGKMYGAKTTPHIFIIDKNGKLVYAGAIDNIKSTNKEDVKKAKNYVKQALDELLSGKEISEPTTIPYGCSVKY